MDTLTCSKCHTNKPLSEFFHDKYTTTGYTYACKPCHSANTQRKRQAKDPDFLAKRRAIQHKRRAQFPDEDAAIARAYRARHPDSVKKTRQKYWQSLTETERTAQRIRLAAYKALHPAHVQDIHTTWRHANPDKVAVYARRRRAQKHAAPHNDLTKEQWEHIKEAFAQRCAYCHRKMKRLEQDHITPLALGGSHTLSNVVPACRTCNAKKGTKGPLIPVQPLLL